MKNTIKGDYCSFEVSKLLNQKGFEVQSYSYYYDNKLFFDYSSFCGYWVDHYFAPTHDIATKWIRENFGIHIYAEYNSGSKKWEENIKDLNSFENTIKIQEEFYKKVGEVDYDKPEEAVDAVLLYTLKNLI